MRVEKIFEQANIFSKKYLFCKDNTAINSFVYPRFMQIFFSSFFYFKINFFEELFFECQSICLLLKGKGQNNEY